MRRYLMVSLLLAAIPHGHAAEAKPEAAAPEISRVYDLRSLDQPPRQIYALKPEYPPELRRGSFPGEVVVRFIIEKDGTVKQAFALRSSRREFERNAIQTVRQWRFEPGKKEGVAVRTQMQVPVIFAVAAGEND